MPSVFPLDLISAIPFPAWLDENVFSVGRFSVKWYGLAYVVGWFLALIYARTVCAEKSLWVPKGVTRGTAVVPNKRMLEDFAFWVLLGVMLGGRIGSILLYNTGKYIDDPLAILRIWEGGMSFHGGFAGVCIATLLFARSRGLEIFRLADLAAIGVPIALFLGRLANFVNQELYGRVTDVPWAFVFQTDPTSLPRHPSQLYEAGLEGLALLLILYVAITRFKVLTRPGTAAAVFIIGYAAFRIFVEFFREPDSYVVQVSEWFTRGMIYSIPMLLAGIALFVWARRRPEAAPRRVEDSVVKFKKAHA